MKSLLPRRRTFPGGVWLHHGRRDEPPPAVLISPTGPLAVPLCEPPSPAATPIVQPEQQVTRCQLIARTERPDVLCVYAPVTGRVIEIATTDTAGACDVPAIVIAPSTDEQPQATPLGLPLPEEPSLDELIDRLAEAAVIDTAEDSQPLHRLLAAARNRPIEHIIVNSIESEPPLAAQRSLLAGQPEAILDAAEMLFRAVGARRIWLTVDSSVASLVGQLESLCHRRPIRLTPLPPKYPQESSVLLARAVLDAAIAPGQRPIDAGVLVLDAATALAAHRAARRGLPQTHGVITVAGDAAARPGCYRVPEGIALADVIKQVGLHTTARKVVIGSPMTGRPIARLHTVLTRRTAAVLLLAKASVPQPIACIRCGRCIHHCPVQLDPRCLLATAETGQVDPESPGPAACLECGTCSLVCSSNLPLLQAIQKLKNSLGPASERDGSDP